MSELNKLKRETHGKINAIYDKLECCKMCQLLLREKRQLHDQIGELETELKRRYGGYNAEHRRRS